MATETYQTAYERGMTEIEFLTEKLEKWKPALDVIEELRLAFPDLQIHTSCGLQHGQVQGALIHLNDLIDMAQALPVAKWLTQRGFHTKGFEDYPELRRRTYDYGDIKLMCFLKYDEGAKCQWVKVGVKEEPVYKLMCEDKPFDAAPDEAVSVEVKP